MITSIEIAICPSKKKNSHDIFFIQKNKRMRQTKIMKNDFKVRKICQIKPVKFNYAIEHFDKYSKKKNEIHFNILHCHNCNAELKALLLIK